MCYSASVFFKPCAFLAANCSANDIFLPPPPDGPLDDAAGGGGGGGGAPPPGGGGGSEKRKKSSSILLWSILKHFMLVIYDSRGVF